MHVPPHGLCLPAAWHRVVRADRLDLIVGCRRGVRVELLGCRAVAGDVREARHWLEAWLEENAELPLSMFVPLHDNLAELMIRWSEPRVKARVFVGATDLAELLVSHGMAEAVGNG